MKPSENTKCTITGSDLCRWLNREDCAACYVGSLRGDAKEEALSNWLTTQSLIPDDIAELAGDECQFCREGKPGKRATYAMVDIAHPKPDSKKAMFFGIGKKVANPIGSMLQLSVSCCKDCKRRFVMYDAIKWISMIACIAAAILICVFIPSAQMFGGGMGDFAPFVVLIISVIVGALLALLLSELYIKGAAKKTRINIFEIPIFARMQEMGWFVPFTSQERKNVARVIFSRKQATDMAALKYRKSGTAASEVKPAAKDEPMDWLSAAGKTDEPGD